MKKLISICIPCFGYYRQWLGECLGSIPDREDIETIVDDTPNVNVARNRAIEKAQGEWILQLDCDDHLSPNFFNIIIPQLENKKIVAPSGQYFGISESKFIPSDRINLEERNGAMGCSLYQKKMWTDVGGYDEQLEGYDDWDLWYRGYKIGYRIKPVPEAIIFVRKKHISRNVNAIKNHKELLGRILCK
jgi:glycosyltransferase involved in cell wall biosynthesis